MSDKLKININFSFEIPKKIYKNDGWTDKQARIYLKEALETYCKDSAIEGLKETIEAEKEV